MPRIVPATSERNLTPSSMGLSGPSSMFCGTALLGQMVIELPTVMLRLAVATWTGFPASLTRAVKFDVPAAVGVPEMAPVLALSTNPAGSAPAEIDHEYGVAPPDATSVAVYGVPTTATGRIVPVSAIGAAVTVSVVFPETLPEVAEIVV